MNLSPLAGLVLAVAVLWSAIHGSAFDKSLFAANHYATLLIFGGTMAVALLAFPLPQLLRLFEYLSWVMFFKRGDSNHRVAEQISRSYYHLLMKPDNFQIDPRVHPFLGESLALMIKQDWTEEELRQVLQERIKQVVATYEADARAFSSLAKYPPAFGLMGTALGMIAMVTNMNHPDFQVLIPALVSAMVCTFWGVAVANFLLLPLADHAQQRAQAEQNTRHMILEAVLGMNKKDSMPALSEKVASFLSITHRPIFKEYVKEQLRNKRPAA